MTEADLSGRSRDEAFSVARGFLAQERDGVEERAVAQIVSNELLSEIFDTAWSHQFDEDRGPARRRLKEIIEDAVEHHLLSDKT